MRVCTVGSARAYGTSTSRRRLSVGLLSTAVTFGPAHESSATVLSGIKDLISGDNETARPQQTPKLDAALASNFLAAVYEAVKEQGVLNEAQFQKENFKLRDREYKYFLAANKGMDRIPDLSDMSGGLSNPLYFNFVYYIAWKVVSQHVKTDQERSAFNMAVGRSMVELVSAEQAQTLVDSAQKNGGRAPVRVVQAQLESILAALNRAGYVENAQIVWGSADANVPFRWERDTRLAVHRDDALALEDELSTFQVRLRKPSDIEGSVSMRSEDDSFWSRAVSSMFAELLRRAGYRSSVDEYFLQDEWQGPQGIVQQLLLFLGDPLMTVDVPWTPQSLIQDWRVSW